MYYPQDLPSLRRPITILRCRLELQTDAVKSYEEAGPNFSSDGIHQMTVNKKDSDSGHTEAMSQCLIYCDLHTTVILGHRDEHIVIVRQILGRCIE